MDVLNPRGEGDAMGKEAHNNMIRRVYRLPNSPTVVTVRAPFYLDDRRMFDDGDLLIATFEKVEEGPPIVDLVNSAGVLLTAVKETIKLLDDDVDNTLDATVILREAVRKVEEST